MIDNREAASPVVVFDTNVLIPMAVKASRSARLFSRLDAAGWTVAVSPQLLAEVKDKMLNKQPLRQWLGFSEEEITQFTDSDLPAMTTIIAGLRQAHGAVKADPDDDAVIAAALESEAAFIVSEDRHLLDLKEYQGIKILNRKDFEAELDRLGVTEIDQGE